VVRWVTLVSVDSLSITPGNTSSAKWSMKFVIVNSRFRHAEAAGHNDAGTANEHL